jgi:GTP-binding protein EngB required for normal cell division
VTANTIGVTGLPHAGLSARLASLTELTRLGSRRAGPDGFDSGLLAEAEMLLRRSGERMRMSASHTVVALAGGTGSGKSSLFNALSGANFSPAGVTRPTTKHTHACVWGMEGAAPLLDWLNVQRRHRYARASALDEGEASLTGLLLLDLPDHDSVVTGSAALVDRLVKLADMLVWVLDPLKYADASVHRGYLVPLAGHASITTVVLNQADTLTPDQVADCESDLRRLLDAEGLHETPVLVTSATTGVGLNELRRVLAEAVAARRAVTERIRADVDALLERFAVYAGDRVPGWLPPDALPLDSLSPEALSPEALTPDALSMEALSMEALSREAGAPRPPTAAGGPSAAPSPVRPPWEVADSDASPNGAGDWQPWQTTTPPTLPARTARPPWEDATPDAHTATEPEDPASYVPPGPAGTLTAAFAKAAGVTAVTETLNGVRERSAAGYIGWPPARLAARLRGQAPPRKAPASEPGTATQAQRPDIDNAITAFADEVGGSLPEPWSRTVRLAARSRVGEAQAALGTAVAQGLPPRDKVAGWWRPVALAQWLLMLLLAGGLAWIALILALHGGRKTSSLVSDVSLVPWLAVMVVALLLLGWLISSWCQNMVVLAADREREQAAQTILSHVAAVATDLVLAPTGRELAAYEHFRTELAAARTPTP